MKKVLGMFLVLVAVMSMTAFADLPTYTPLPDGTYSIDYTEGKASNYYALLVVEGICDADATPVISEDTVLYIDQATADANGDVSFDGWIPKNNEPATVYLGGSNLTDGPVLLGYLGSSTFVVSGTVTSDISTTYEATVTLTDAENNVFTATSVNGAYAVEVPEGTYTFTVNVKNHLSYTDNDFEVSADVSGKDISVRAGDINDDGKVNEMDLGRITTNLGSTTSDCDLNGDGRINELDLGKVTTNLGSVAKVE